MVHHIILWKLKDGYTPEEQETIRLGIRQNLTALVGKIDGLLSLTVLLPGLSSSTADVMLDSTFRDAEALKAYSVHPDHVRAADTFVRPFTSVRLSLDYED